MVKILALLGALAVAQGQSTVSAECKKAVEQVVAHCAPQAPGQALDLAETQRQWFENWYHKLGFNLTVVPKPAVSNYEFARRRKLGQELFYRPATSQVSYEQFMNAVGQGKDWTVTDQAERAKIVWEPTATGYWFWTEVAADCPRLRTTWNSLNQAVRLLSLE
jgi:hypothetical protein